MVVAGVARRALRLDVAVRPLLRDEATATEHHPPAAWLVRAGRRAVAVPPRPLRILHAGVVAGPEEARRHLRVVRQDGWDRMEALVHGSGAEPRTRDLDRGEHQPQILVVGRDAALVRFVGDR